MLPLENSASASHWLCGNSVSIRETMRCCSSMSFRFRASSISRYKPPRAVLVVRVGQRLRLCRCQPFQLQLAGRFGHCKSVAGLSVQPGLLLQSAILFGRLLSSGRRCSRHPPRLRSSATVRDGLGSQRSQLGSRCLSLPGSKDGPAEAS